MDIRPPSAPQQGCLCVQNLAYLQIVSGHRTLALREGSRAGYVQGFDQWVKRVGSELHAAVQAEVDTLAASGPEGLPRGLTSAGFLLDHVKVQHQHEQCLTLHAEQWAILAGCSAAEHSLSVQLVSGWWGFMQLREAGWLITAAEEPDAIGLRSGAGASP